MESRLKHVLVAASLVVLGAGCSSVTYSEDFDRGVEVTPAASWAWQPLSDAQQQALAEVSPFLQRRIERAVEHELGGRDFTLVLESPSDYLVSAYALLPDRSSRPGTAPYRSEYDVRGPAPVSMSVGFGVGFGYPYRFGSPYGFGRWGYGFWPAFNYWNPYSWYLGARWGWGRPYFGYRSYGWRPFFGYGVYSMGGYGRPAVIGSGDRAPGTLVIDVIESASGEVVWQGLAKGALLDMPSGDELDAYIDQVVRRTLQGFPPGA
ncbi:MAG: DUF4136 domain-containing protein [Gemmatimonadetes bacterium]|nr:DUF4136 domain-containing protein [Gemmatimonadota bacterium]